ncbi:GDP-mannose 4,6-dehydratase [bacterium]|nr:GDP-mannose 4,6-dehydratase [bacterium]
MRILVTGGAGFIGSNFVIRSLESKSNLSITVLDSLTYAGSVANLEGSLQFINFVRGDIRDEIIVDNLVSSADLVVHFAAESHNDNSLENPRIFFDTNVMGTLTVASACAKYNVRLHHISTDEVFGDLPLESTESFSSETPYKPSSPYSASKASSDHVVRSWIRSMDLVATISNCSNNYGPRQHWEKLIPHTIRNLHNGVPAKLYGDGLNVRDWIHVDDHIDGIWLAIERGVPGETYLFGSRDTQSNKSVVECILEKIGLRDAKLEFIRDRPGHDRKYAVDPVLAEKTLGWKPARGSILNELENLIPWYEKLLRD